MKVTPQSLRMAMTIVTTLPIIVVYPFLQKYFIKGMTLGAVKEKEKKGGVKTANSSLLSVEEG